MLCRRRRGMGAVRPLAFLLTPMMLLRIASAAGATVFIVLSLRYLPLATVITVLQVTPLAVTAGAAIIYRERVGWRVGWRRSPGFLGVVLIVKPGGGFGAAAYLALATLVFTTTRDLTTRGLHQTFPRFSSPPQALPPSRWRASSSLPSTGRGRCRPAWAWWLMTMSAACLFVANTAIIMALRTGEMSVIAPFRYVTVPMSILARLLVVGRRPRCASAGPASAWCWRPDSIRCIASGAA